MDFRVTATDTAGPTGPLLSPARPRIDRPAWDTVVWFDTATFPGTPGAYVFHRDLEQWMVRHFAGWAAVRPEWPKGWGYGPEGPWTDDFVLRTAWPEAFRAGQPAGSRWEDAIAVLERHDPAGVFRGPFVEALFSDAR